MKKNVAAASNRNRILFGVSIAAMAAAATQPVHAQCVGNEDGSCTITNAGATGDISAAVPTRIVNTGTIGAISQPASGFLIVDNRSGGVVDSATFEGIAASSGPVGNVFINAGTVTGDVTFTAVPGLGSVFVNDGGTVQGSVTSITSGPDGGQSSIFINRSASGMGVTGTVDFTSPYDHYLTSFSTSGSYDMSAPLPTSFEYGGVEVLGSGTTVTLTGSGNFIGLIGNGHVINNGTVGAGAFSFPGIGGFLGTSSGTVENSAFFGRGPVEGIYKSNIFSDPIFGQISIEYGGALASFTNNGTVNGDFTYFRTASFTNTGTINLRSSDFGSIIISAADQDFDFTNSGIIDMADTDVRAIPIEPYFRESIALMTAIDATTLTAVSITNESGGEIRDGLTFVGVASDFTFENAGLIAIGDNPNGIDRAVNLDLGRLPYALNPAFLEDAIADTVTITNSGTLDGGMEGDFSTRSLSFTNTATGHINSDTTDPYAAAVELSTDDWPNAGGGEDVNDADTFTFLNDGIIEGTVGLDAEATYVEFTNNGSITQALRPGNTVYVDPDAEDAVAIIQETTLGAELAFTNNGLISNADYGGGAVYIELEAGSISSGIPEAATATAVVSVTNGGTIRASGGSYVTTGYDGIPLSQAKVDFANALDITTDAEGISSVTVNNQLGGLIDARGEYHVGQPSGPLDIAGQPAGVGSMALSVVADEVTITNAGTILGGADSFGNGLVTTDGVTLIPIVHDGRNFEGMLGTAIDTFGGTDEITNTATGVIEGGVALRSGDDIFRNYGSFTGDLYLGDGNDTFIQGVAATFIGTADGGAGTDTFILDLTGGGTINGSIYDQLINFELLTTTGSGAVDIDGTVGDDNLANEGTLDGDVDLGEGNDSFTQSGTINGDVDLGAGNDEIVQSGTINGDLDLGEGDDTLDNQGTINGDIYADGGPDMPPVPAGFTAFAVSMEVAPTPGDDDLSNEGTINGSVFAGGGNDSFTNTGSITGDVDMGDGNDELVLSGDWSIDGDVTGGAGTDTLGLTFSAASSGDEPDLLDLSGFDSFEQLDIDGGTGKITGSASFDQIDVNSGRLIGAADSLITGDVNVGSGGTFGSAGTVAGDISVASGGTLAPGASPAVMTVIGDVSLASGSITTFEFVPAPGQSDQLLIDGDLTIASGAILNLTGTRPLTPGTPYDLVIADNIDGKFTINSWDKSAIQGFLRYSDGTLDDRLQLVGTFVPASGTGPQALLALNYANGLLISGNASTALLNAIPSLLDGDGYGSAAAFALLGPEPYATASQLGIEQGLGVSRAMRTGLAEGNGENARLFAFAGALGNWRSLKANGTLGTSRAKGDGYGFLGGIGFGSKTGSIAAFVGYNDSTQKISALGARTKADGMFAGLRGHAQWDALELNATVAYDWSDAATDRTVPGNVSVTSSQYDLHSFIFDATVSYAMPIGGGWDIAPELGFTHISNKRGTASEIGSAAFALAIEKERTTATFVDAAITLRGGQDDSATVKPWAQLGLRHQLDGRHVTATAGFAGLVETFTVAGAPRKNTVMIAGAGLDVQMAEGVSLFAAYQGEFGGGNASQISGGLKLSF